MKRINDISWGSGIQDAYLNIANGELLLGADTHNIEYLHKGKNYYKSQSGLSGSSSCYLPDEFVKCNVYRPDTRCEIRRVSRAVNISAYPAPPVYVSFYIPIHSNASSEKGRDYSYPFITVVQYASRKNSLGSSDVKHVAYLTPGPLEIPDMLKDIVENINGSENTGTFSTKYRVNVICLEDVIKISLPGNARTFSIKYGVNTANPDGWIYKYTVIGSLLSLKKLDLDMFIDTRFIRDLEESEEIDAVHTMFGIKKFCNEYVHMVRGKSIRSFGETSPIMNPEEMKYFVGAGLLSQTQKTVCYKWYDKIIAITKVPEPFVSSLGSYYEYEVEIPNIFQFTFAKVKYVKEAINGVRRKLRLDISNNKKATKDNHDVAIIISQMPRDMIITIQDSLDSGNCECGTMNFKDRYFPERESVTVEKLYKHANNMDVRRVLLYVANKNVEGET